MTVSTSRSKPAKTDDIVSDISDKVEAMLGDNGAVIVDKLEATGAEKLEDLRSLITARPITAVATGLAAGILLRSVFRGPVSTLLLMGGATYLGARYAARA